MKRHASVAQPQLFEIPLRLRCIGKRRLSAAIGGASLAFLLGALGVYSFNDPAPRAPSNSFEQISNQDLAQFLDAGLSADSHLRTAIRAASIRQSDEISYALSRLSTHSNYRVRVEVIRALTGPAYRMNERTLPTLKTLLRDEEYLVRGFAAQALGDVGTAEAAALLEERLKLEAHPVVRMAMLRALTKDTR